MRQYSVTTNSDLVLELPALTVTVRSAFYNPSEVLPPQDAGETRGRDTWSNPRPVLAFFQLSDRIEEGKPVGLKDVVDPDGKGTKDDPADKRVQAVRKSRSSGVAFTDVRYSAARTQKEEKNHKKEWVAVSSNSINPELNDRPRVLGEAILPLWQVTRGDYLLAILPPDNALTKPEVPCGPTTTIEPGVDWTYRPLYVRLSFDDELKLTRAETVLFKDGVISPNPEIKNPAGKKVGRGINHGYVTALSHSELAIDLKPDFIRCTSTVDRQRAAAESGKWSREVDLIVVHTTAGPLIGGAVNTVVGHTKYFAPHYELDLDGHIIKFAYDDEIMGHCDASQIYSHKTGRYTQTNNVRSIGIEVVNYAGDYLVPQQRTQEPYREHQIRALMVLLEQLKASHGVKRYRIVGHGDISSDGAQLSGGRRACPGRQMHWPRLEERGLGRACVKRALTNEDYSGFFSLVPADLPAGFKYEQSGAALALRKNDSDRTRTWGGASWTGTVAMEALAKKGLTLNGIVLELQKDMQTLGYLTNTDGVFTDTTYLALEHMIWRTYSGARRGEILGGDGNRPLVMVTPEVAAYIKGSVDLIESDLAVNDTIPPPFAVPGAPPEMQVAEPGSMVDEAAGDVHDRLADADPQQVDPDESDEGDEGDDAEV